MTAQDLATHDATAPLVPQPLLPRVPWRAVIAFVAIAYGLGWALVLPIWFNGGLFPGGQFNPLFGALALPYGFTPAFAAVVVTLLLLRPEHPARFLGLVPLRPWRRTIGYALVGLIATTLLGFAALGLGVLSGAVQLHPTSGAALTLLAIPLVALITAIGTFGEELGWRGFLLPALRPLGTWPALLIQGLVWGPWHAPVILLGYNYGRTDALGLVLMTITTVLVGFFFGWLRMRSASVWPSTIAHGALNGSAGVVVTALVLAPGQNANIHPVPDATVLGWPGWIVTAVLVVALAIGGAFRWAPQAAARRTSTRA